MTQSDDDKDNEGSTNNNTTTTATMKVKLPPGAHFLRTIIPGIFNRVAQHLHLIDFVCFQEAFESTCVFVCTCVCVL